MAERLITINLRKYLVKQPRTKRARKAARYVKERVAHYTKLNPENVKLGYDLNNLIFKYYSRSMVPLKVRVKIGTDTADVLPYIEGQPVQEEKKEGKKKLFSITKSRTEEAKKEQPQPPAGTKKEEKAQQKQQNGQQPMKQEQKKENPAQPAK